MSEHKYYGWNTAVMVSLWLLLSVYSCMGDKSGGIDSRHKRWCTDDGIGNTNNRKYKIGWDNITRERHMSELKTLEETFALIEPRRNEW